MGAVLIVVNLLLALIGGVAGVFLAGGVLNVVSIIWSSPCSASPRATASCSCRTSLT
jgi:hypothetical protein